MAFVLAVAQSLFSGEAIAIGVVIALVVGLSKTALPGAGLLASPLLALVVSGRAIPGVALPILLFADMFAVGWYRQHTRWDLLRPLTLWVTVGFAAGAAFFVAVGSNTRVVNVVIGLAILVVVSVQVARIVRQRPPQASTTADAVVYGTAGGFTTFVSNSAGPIVNTYLVGLGLDKTTLVGTSAWFYFAVNLAKVPVYLGLDAFSDGGRFFTGDSLRYNLMLLPVVVVGVFGGRRLLHRIPEQLFLWLVLALSLVGAVKLLLP
jgi:uncharacterized membrane protein YfcA